MSTHVKALLELIMEELAVSDRDRDEIEAKAIFRLLNYCPPEDGARRFLEQPEKPPE